MDSVIVQEAHYGIISICKGNTVFTAAYASCTQSYLLCINSSRAPYQLFFAGIAQSCASRQRSASEETVDGCTRVADPIPHCQLVDVVRFSGFILTGAFGARPQNDPIDPFFP